MQLHLPDDTERAALGQGPEYVWRLAHKPQVFQGKSEPINSGAAAREEKRVTPELTPLHMLRTSKVRCEAKGGWPSGGTLGI